MKVKKGRSFQTVSYDFDLKQLDQKQYIKILLKRQRKKVICLFKKLLLWRMPLQQAAAKA